MATVADTAFAIAAIRRDEALRPPEERLFEDPYAGWFAEAGAHADEGVARFRSLPFLTDGVRLRTRFIDDAVRDAIEAGLRQLVILGAGFDARALRLPAIGHASVRVFELDFAEQLATKRAVLAAHGVAWPAHVEAVACDFRASDSEAVLDAGLALAGFAREAGAMFVWEGVLAYLAPEDAERTMRFMASRGGPGSRVAFEFQRDRVPREMWLNSVPLELRGGGLMSSNSVESAGDASSS
jgi:methyltransferase (TIGR00027 family)